MLFLIKNVNGNSNLHKATQFALKMPIPVGPIKQSGACRPATSQKESKVLMNIALDTCESCHMEWYCFMWSFYPWASVPVVWLPRLYINKKKVISHMCPALCSLQQTFTFMTQFNSSYKLFIPISQIKRQRLPNQWIIFTVILHCNSKGIYCLSCQHPALFARC